MSLFVVGALHLDVVVRAPYLPTLDETVTGHGVDYVFGGKGGNQAVAAARMGAEVSFAGRVGSDGFAQMLWDGLRDGGVDHAQLQQDSGASGMSTAIVEDSGEYGAVIVSAANLRIDPDRIDVPAAVSILLLQNEVPEAVSLAIAQKARDAGARIWLNAAPARTIGAELLAMVDLMIVNRIEAQFYDPLPVSAQVLTTLGADGVLYDGETWPGHSVEVISTHGAGDMFVGALAAKVAEGQSIAQAIGFAQAAAALHVSTQPSARGMLTQKDVEAFLTAQESR